MSNYGLEKYLFSLGIKFLRSDVGDRHVKEMMKTKITIVPVDQHFEDACPKHFPSGPNI